MLCYNCYDLGEQTSNIEWGSGVFSTISFTIKRVVLVGALKVLLKDNVSTNYVAYCRSRSLKFKPCHYGWSGQLNQFFVILCTVFRLHCTLIGNGHAVRLTAYIHVHVCTNWHKLYQPCMCNYGFHWLLKACNEGTIAMKCMPDALS